MTTTETTKPLSAEARLRAELKAAGYNARRVTVRRDYSSLHVTIRDASVSLSAIKEIADQYVRVSRDHATGEILCGGNTFVDVEYLKNLYEARSTEISTTIENTAKGIMIALPGGFRAVRSNGGLDYLDEVCMWGPGLSNGGLSARACGIKHAANRIAIAYLDASARGFLADDNGAVASEVSS